MVETVTPLSEETTAIYAALEAGNKSWIPAVGDAAGARALTACEAGYEGFRLARLDRLDIVAGELKAIRARKRAAVPKHARCAAALVALRGIGDNDALLTSAESSTGISAIAGNWRAWRALFRRPGRAAASIATGGSARPAIRCRASIWSRWHAAGCFTNRAARSPGGTGTARAPATGAGGSSVPISGGSRPLLPRGFHALADVPPAPNPRPAGLPADGDRLHIASVVRPPAPGHARPAR
ncbi:MAG: hypothetical protein OXI87_19485 [Albidovulum sp.]|nr:hypothetical protein [Albidovulum sp.]